MDKLSHLILQAVADTKWKDIKAGRSGPVVSHLMFADDHLLFGEASEKQMKCVIDTLNQFCNMSRQELQCGSNDYSVLRGKYDDVVRNSDSSFWKELMKLRPMLENFTFWHVGNGSEIDARVVPRAGIGHSTTTTWHEVLVKHIWRILELDWKVEVSHTYREANRCADTLDNIGCSADYETMMYDVCPSHLSDLLAADCTGLSTPKLITV
ncbi:hypothetical protein P8452_13202 [Trifolium repens]|nr:hypothetical protein P8452_13202 [Trifolium repens]